MKQKLPIPKEDIESQHFAQWLAVKGLKFTHIANESGLPPKVAMIAAAKKKRLGLSPGVPDFMVILPERKCKSGSHKLYPPALLFIEMKRIKGGRVSPEQQSWITELNNIPNVEAIVCRGAQEAIDFISGLL